MIQTLETGEREEESQERVVEGIHRSGSGQSVALERRSARCAARFCRRDGMLVRAMWEYTNRERMPAVAAAIMLSASQSVEARVGEWDAGSGDHEGWTSQYFSTRG